MRAPYAPAKSASLSRQEPAASQALGETRVHSSPSSSIASCVALRCTTPSRIGGQVKRPCCSHFVTSTMPLPSHARSFTLSVRLLRNTKTSPQYGFARSASLTSADSVCTDLRKSTGCAASTTLRSARSAITGRLEAPTAPSKASPAPLPARPGCAPRSPRSRSPRTSLPGGDAISSSTVCAGAMRSGSPAVAATALAAQSRTGTKLGALPPAAVANLCRHTVSSPRATPLRRATSEMLAPFLEALRYDPGLLLGRPPSPAPLAR